MPKIDRALTLDIPVELFLNHCSAIELREIEILLQSKRYHDKMYPTDDGPLFDGIPEVKLTGLARNFDPDDIGNFEREKK